MSNPQTLIATTGRSTSPSAVSAILAALARRMAIVLTRRQLMSLDDHMLKDIGLTRADVMGDFVSAGRRWSHGSE